jgi:predicted O-methyltransferase YrrM
MSAHGLRSHWTPRYVLDRSRLAIHQRRHRDEPWLTADAVCFLNAWVRPTDRYLEWGSGSSTMWFAARVASVTSIEHDSQWAQRVAQATVRLGAAIHLVDEHDVDRYASRPEGVVEVDIALVDGIHRDRCALASIDVVVAGGIVVIDNVERYLPSDSRSPESIGHGWETDGWRTFDELTPDWRRYWTTNGVTDTAVFFKPSR